MGMPSSAISRPIVAKQQRGHTNYGDQFMTCPECGGSAEAEAVDVGVGLYIKDEYECLCGWNSAADGMMRVATYSDWFPDQEPCIPFVATQQEGGEFWAQFHLLKHLAENMTESNWRDKRLYILRHLDRLAGTT